MITGDHEHTARWIANQVGIEHVFAQVKPEEKAQVIEQLKAGSVIANKAESEVKQSKQSEN
jgi:Cu+-exporting ATPase